MLASPRPAFGPTGGMLFGLVRGDGHGSGTSLREPDNIALESLTPV